MSEIDIQDQNRHEELLIILTPIFKENGIDPKKLDWVISQIEDLYDPYV